MVPRKRSVSTSIQAGDGATPPVALIFDTETTDKVNFSKPFQDSSQPDLVQLGMILVDTIDWKKRLQVSLLIRDAPTIPLVAQRIHGISNSDCQSWGVPLTTALDLFENAYQQADCIVAHNIQFDWTVINTSLHRRNKTLQDCNNNVPRQICTMRESMDVLELPGKGAYNNDFKWPSLEEAHRHFTGKSVVGAHDALTDAEACLTVFRGLVESEVACIDKRKQHQEEGAKDEIPLETQYSFFGEKKCSDPEDFQNNSTPSSQPMVVAQPGELRIVLEEKTFRVEGNTYNYRSNLKALGAMWNPAGKAWVFPCHSMLGAAKKLVGDTS